MPDEPIADPESDEQVEERPDDDPDEAEDEGPPTTPFDHPFFLPVILWGFTIWFGVDTFMDTEVGRENFLFNHYGFGVVLLGAINATIAVVCPVPYGLAMLFAAYALWFGYMGWIGEGWYGENELRVWFNQVTAGVMLAAAILNRLWNLRPRRRKDPAD